MMEMIATESPGKIPFAFDERVLVRSSSGAALESSESTTTTTKTVRLESLAQWKGHVWIHPFSDIDIGLSSGVGGDYQDKIARVQMSISSHGAQRFPNRSNHGLDPIPVLPLWKDQRENGEASADGEHERHLSLPQGFFLSVRPIGGLAPEEEARAVQALFAELIRKRLLTTPVTGGEWDVVYDEGSSNGDPNVSPRLYQLVMPFDGAAWSSDAIAQSFRRTLPKVCGTETTNDRFFGWSGLEWSNFLVGYKDGGGEQGKGYKQSLQHHTYNKVMWWTWTSSSSLSETNGNTNEQSLSFGIQYQTIIPSNAKDWLPENFLDETSKCRIGERNAFEVLPLSTTNTNNSHQLVPIGESDEEVANNETSELLESKFPYSVGIEQVLRRHHTNQGRFESSIDLNPLFDPDDFHSVSCRMKYRQLLPDFLTPMWRSLQISDGDHTVIGALGDGFYSNSDPLRASVEWNPEDQSSVLVVEAESGPPSSTSSFASLPPSVLISLEYTPSFLTIDDFPGDPNRGRVLPPSSVTVVCDPSTVPNGQSTKTVVYSNSLLLLPPVPDLSMPFNVISLTSSLYAYIVGAMITILVRKGSEKIKYTMHPDKKPESKLAKLKTKLRQKIGRVRAKLLGKEINDNSSTARENDSHEEPTTAPKNTSELSETLKRSSGDLTENKT